MQTTQAPPGKAFTQLRKTLRRIINDLTEHNTDNVQNTDEYRLSGQQLLKLLRALEQCSDKAGEKEST